MDLLISAATQVCILITMNYIVLRIGNRWLAGGLEHWLVPLLAGTASVLIMLNPFPERWLLSDLRFIPAVMAGLRFGLGAATLSSLLPILYDALIEGAHWGDALQWFILPVLMSHIFRRKHDAKEHRAISVRAGVAIGIILSVYHAVYVLMMNRLNLPEWLLQFAAVLAVVVVTMLGLIFMMNDEQRYWSLLHGIQLKAHQDTLTRLPNYRSFAAIAESTMKTRPISIMMIDIDFFKNYNDRLGHLEGDKLLLQVGNLLLRNIGEKDYLARYGGEEFILMCHSNDAFQVEHLASRLCAAIAEYPFEGRDVQPDGVVSISIGIALPLKEGDSLFHMISRADLALYHSKNEGKNRYTFYHEIEPAHAASGDAT